MAYSYFQSGSSITFLSSQQMLINDFQDILDDEFAIAPNVYTIYKESSFASGSLTSIQVRVNTAIESETGTKLGDDYKVLLFKSISDAGTIGSKYYFDSNYWISVNKEVTKNLAASCTVRRANNTLRWTNSSGSQLSEHCVIDYGIAAPKNTYRSDPLVPDGTIHVIAQLNSKTKQIKENQRFLFGNSDQWSCWKIYGAGIANFLNQQTEINTSASLVEFAMGRDYVNEDLDNLILGIADYYKVTSSGSTLVDEIHISPVPDYILEGETETYECYLYSSGSATADVFTFAISGSSTVPVDHYTLTSISGNNFSVENLEMYLDDPLKIICSTGSGSGLNTREIEILLKGDW